MVGRVYMQIGKHAVGLSCVAESPASVMDVWTLLMERCRGVWIETADQGWVKDGGVKKGHAGGPPGPVCVPRHAVVVWAPSEAVSQRERGCRLHPSPRLKEEHVPCGESCSPDSDRGSHWSPGLDSVLLLCVEVCQTCAQKCVDHTAPVVSLVNWSPYSWYCMMGACSWLLLCEKKKKKTGLGLVLSLLARLEHPRYLINPSWTEIWVNVISLCKEIHTFIPFKIIQ